MVKQFFECVGCGLVMAAIIVAGCFGFVAFVINEPRPFYLDGIFLAHEAPIQMDKPFLADDE